MPERPFCQIRGQMYFDAYKYTLPTTPDVS